VNLFWILAFAWHLECGAFAGQENASNAAVMDFEADVIQGERLRPDIFVQMGSQAQQMGPVLYLRKDFNDFHASSRRWRPGYYEPRALMPASQGEKRK